MSLYADILRSEWADEHNDIRQDGDTWTVCPSVLSSVDEEIPGIPTKAMALAIARAIKYAYDRGVDSQGYS